MILGNSNKVVIDKIFGNNSKKDSLVTVPSALLKSIVIDFMKSHPKDMELLKNGRH